MSNRAEKEQRRQERLAAEQEAQRAAERRKRFGLVGGVVLLAAIAVIVVLAVAGGGDDDGGSASSGGSASTSAPTFNVTNVNEAARDAGCEVSTEDLPSEGDGHTDKDVKYKASPPHSGDHDPAASEEGIYADGPPDLEQSVHALEHGRINFQYKPGSPEERIAQLESMVNEKVKGTEGYHSLMFENQTGMEYAVAATAWQRTLTCAEWNDKVFDALRAFRKDQVDKGPEFIP